MNRARKTNPQAGGLRDSGNVGTDQGSNRAKHTPPNIMALCLLLHTAVSAARGIVSRLAMLTDSPPFGLVDAADSLDEAGDLIAALVATGGKP